MSGGGGILDRVARELASRSASDPPVVTVSWAQTLNGIISRDRSAPTPISSAESLELTHRLRSMHSAILVGIGTILADDPRLSVRLVEGPQPRPVVLDSGLRTPPHCRLMERRDTAPWIFHSVPGPDPGAELTARGARLFRVGRGGAGLDLGAVLSILGENGVSSVMVEGGAGVLASFVGRGIARQAVVTVSPSLMKDGIPAFDRGVLPWALSLEEAVWEAHGRDAVLWGKILAAYL